jgi:hypothetical protein
MDYLLRGQGLKLRQLVVFVCRLSADHGFSALFPSSLRIIDTVQHPMFRRNKFYFDRSCTIQMEPNMCLIDETGWWLFIFCKLLR